jgi:membrane protein DedA with SNARE-associated domain
VLYTTLGSGIWNTALIGAGWWLGDQWQTVSAYMQYAQYAIYAAIAIGVGWVVYKRAGERERAEG